MEQNMDAGMARQYLHGIAIFCRGNGLLSEENVRKLESVQNIALWGVIKEAVRGALVASQGLEDAPLAYFTEQAWVSTRLYGFFDPSPESDRTGNQLADMPASSAERWERIVAAVEKHCGLDADGTETEDDADDEDDRPTRVQPAEDRPTRIIPKPENFATELMAQHASSPPPPPEETDAAAPDLETALKRASESPMGGAAMTMPPVTNPNFPPRDGDGAAGRNTVPDTPSARPRGSGSMRPGPRPDAPSVGPIVRSPVPRISKAPPPAPVESFTRLHVGVLLLCAVLAMLFIKYRSSGPTDTEANAAADAGVPMHATVQDPWKDDGTTPTPNTAAADAGIVTNGVSNGGVRVGPVLEASDARKPLDLDELEEVEHVVKSPPMVTMLPPRTVCRHEGLEVACVPVKKPTATTEAYRRYYKGLLNGVRPDNSPPTKAFLCTTLQNISKERFPDRYCLDAPTEQMLQATVDELVDAGQKPLADLLKDARVEAAAASGLPASGL